MFFGTANSSSGENTDLKSLSMCDYVVPDKDTGFGNKHFCIFYDHKDNKFKIVDLFNGNGTFILLSK